MTWESPGPELTHLRDEITATDQWSVTLAATADQVHYKLSEASDALPKVVLREDDGWEFRHLADVGPAVLSQGSISGTYYHAGDRGAAKAELRALLAELARSDTQLVGLAYTIHDEEGPGRALNLDGSAPARVRFSITFGYDNN